MFMTKSWLPEAWYVGLDELQNVFLGFFRGGGDWAEIWTVNTDLSIFRDTAKFRRVYIETFFDSLDCHVSCVKLILDKNVFETFVSELRANKHGIRDRLSELGSKASRVLVRAVKDGEKLPVKLNVPVGFCAIRRRLKFEDGPLFFYRVADPAHRGSRDMVVAARMRTGEAFFSDASTFETAFHDSSHFLGLDRLLAEGDGPLANTGPQTHIAGDPLAENPLEVRVLLVAALDEEARFIVGEFNKNAEGTRCAVLREVADDGAKYWEGSLFSKSKRFLYHLVLVTCQEAKGSVDSGVVTTVAGLEFRPNYVVLLGIAGGRKERFDKEQYKKLGKDNLQLGHVVYGTGHTAYEYEKWEDAVVKRHEEPDGRKMIRRLRPRHFNADGRLLHMANALDSGGFWKSTISTGNNSESRELGAMSGHILSGCKVIATRKMFKLTQDDVIALEMEAEGVWKACSLLNRGFIVIKGISDWADPDKGGPGDENSRELAARASARFLKEALEAGHLYLPEAVR